MRRTGRQLLLTMTLALAACGARAGSQSSGDADPAVAAGSIPLTCGSHAPPAFAKRCAADTDCIAAFHLVDVCGSVRPVGIASSESDRFDALQQGCREEGFGLAECLAELHPAEDGRSTSDPTRIAAECRAGACTTVVR